MPTNDEVIEELRAIRVRLDQLAAHFFQAKAADDLLPVWDCGHRHRNRAEAVSCKGKQVLGGKTSDNLRVLANAETGSFD